MKLSIIQMTTPCQIEKCLKFPACQNKEEIVCDTLHTWCTYVEEKLGNQGMFKHLHSTMPNLRTVKTTTYTESKNGILQHATTM